jgi:Na+-transporting NADH:ubiquinone oxidoreductase subunit C
MAIKREGNLYTIIYSAVLVLVVGVALSLVYQTLKPRQDENIANDKKRQILAAALITPKSGESISDIYASHIVEKTVNSRGFDVKGGAKAFDVNVSEQVKKSDNERLLPVYICGTPDGTKYIVPVYGAGLWGPIWGYVAFDSDGATIYGAYFAHQGETPGLGAEIEKPKFQDQFRGKSVYDNDTFTSVKVAKVGQEPAQGSYVHAVSGGTITSQGVQRMLENSLRPYDAYFKNLQSANK